jgi:hypothetical protein
MRSARVSNQMLGLGPENRLSRLGILAEPMGYVDGLNLYEYVEGSPVDQLDPLGLDDGPTFTQGAANEQGSLGNSHVNWNQIPTFGVTMVDFTWEVRDCHTNQILNDEQFASRFSDDGYIPPGGTNRRTQFWLNGANSISTGDIVVGGTGDNWPPADFYMIPLRQRADPAIFAKFFNSFRQKVVTSCTKGYMRLDVESRDYDRVDPSPFQSPPGYGLGTTEGPRGTPHNRTPNVFQHLLTGTPTGWTDIEPPQWKQRGARTKTQTLEIRWDRCQNPGTYNMKWFGTGAGAKEGQASGNFNF